jgi:hypothetical protein
MRIFKTRWFARFARNERITDESLQEAIARAERGLIDANLGGGLIKQRVARKGQGRSGGYRMMIAYRVKDRAVYFFGFAKSDRENRENIDQNELLTMRKVAADFLASDANGLARAIEENEIEEVSNDREET